MNTTSKTTSSRQADQKIVERVRRSNNHVGGIQGLAGDEDQGFSAAHPSRSQGRGPRIDEAGYGRFRQAARAGRAGAG